MKKRVTKTLHEATKEDVERWMERLSQGKCNGSRRLRKQLNTIMNTGELGNELAEEVCECRFAMIRRDQETQKAYCFQCKKLIQE